MKEISTFAAPTIKNFDAMKKLTLFTILTLAVCTGVHAQNSHVVNVNDALNSAVGFLPLRRGGENKTPELAYVEKDSVNDHPYYYIFNRGDEQGFIIVSADSRTKKILAYSNEGHFDIDALAPEMKAWLGGYTEALSDLAMTPDSLLAQLQSGPLMKAANDDSALAPEVKPLLGNICYAQTFPYNAMCPNKSLTGCVATGAVQIMRFYEFPKKPSGKTHSYDNEGETVSCSFTTTYDWNNMLPTYSKTGGAEAENSAISKLMFDAGAACNMEYSPTGSSASRIDMAQALVEYFGYGNNMVNFRRDAFTPGDFVYYLKKELTEGRPVLMGGTDEDDYGHCFVCDGYDTNGLFHFNWGWNGQSNGYFEITNLSPPRPGSRTGKVENYNENVTFIGGIQPPSANTENKVSVLSMQGLECAPNGKKGTQVIVKVERVSNCTIGQFNGKFGVALYKNGEMVKTLELTDASLTPTRSYKQLQFRPVLPSNISGDDYQLVMVSKANNDSKWRPILTAGVSCIDLDVKGDNVTLKPNTFDRYIDLGNLTASSTNTPGKKDKKSKKDDTKSVTEGLGNVDANDFYGN